jgi:competence protein ComGC
MIQDIYFWLQFSSLVLVHLLLIFGLIISIQIIFCIRKITQKVDEITETSKEAIKKVGDIGNSVTDFLTPFSNRGGNTLLNIVGNFFRRK